MGQERAKVDQEQLKNDTRETESENRPVLSGVEEKICYLVLKQRSRSIDFGVITTDFRKRMGRPLQGRGEVINKCQSGPRACQSGSKAAQKWYQRDEE